MDKRKGIYKSNDDEARKIDLTLKLGPSSVHYNQNQGGDDQVHGFSNAVYQSFNQTGNWNNVEYGSPYWRNEGGSANYMMYQGGFPYNNVATSDRKRSAAADDGKACKACGSSSTPLWRKGPDGPQTLCNACGLRHLRTVKKGGE